MDASQLGDSVLSAAAVVAVRRTIGGLKRKGETGPDPKLVQARLEVYAREVSTVRTLLSVESRVALDRFFCPPRVKKGGSIFIADDSSRFYDNHVLVEGIAGQGKSILLRHLCASSILKHGRIALYYELRRLDRLKSLETTIREDLASFGLPAKEADLRYLAASRDLEIYLDGFDEIDQKQTMQIDRDITRLQRLHPHLKIIVSARPHAGMGASDVLIPVRIEKLDHRDVERLIDKISLNEELANGLKGRIRNHSGNAIDLLETPLLVTLLIAQYAQTQQIPEQLSEFYDNIFPLLFERHDSLKVPFVRARRLKVTNALYRQAFQAFAYASLCISPIAISAARDIAEWSLGESGVEGDPDEFLEDISEISSLIAKDGSNWVFIHNSIQEFFAAQYLLSRQDAELASAVLFLKGLPNQHAVAQVLAFAKGLSPVKITRFVEIPLLEAKLSPIKESDAVSDAAAASWLESHVANVEFDNNIVPDGRNFSVWLDQDDLNPIRLFALDEQVSELNKILRESPSPAQRVRALLEWKVSGRLKSEAKKILAPMHERLNQLYEVVEKDDCNAAASQQFLRDLLSKKKVS